MQTFCGFLSLRTGAITAGSITMVISIIGILECAISLAGIQNSTIRSLEAELDGDAGSVVLILSASIFMAVLLGWFVTSILLIVGIYRNKHGMVSSWIVFTFIMICFCLLGVLSLLFKISSHDAYAVRQFVLACIHILVMGYLLVVVANYKKTMPSYQAAYTAVAFTIPGHPYNPCELPPKYEA